MKPVANEKQIAVVSWNENGFWQGDIWLDVEDEEELRNSGAAPDGFFTMKRTERMEDAIVHAARKWPHAEIRLAVDEDDEDEDDKPVANGDGWQTVPREPTKEMYSAAKRALSLHIEALPEDERARWKSVPRGHRLNLKTKTRLRYQAMLAVAPSHPGAAPTQAPVEVVEQIERLLWNDRYGNFWSEVRDSTWANSRMGGEINLVKRQAQRIAASGLLSSPPVAEGDKR